MSRTTLPLVYSCSGCSNVAQLANDVALRLDREGLAQMSCIVGVGGQVPALVNLARSGRPILALDGCPLECVASCLHLHDLQADQHVILSQMGLRKRYGEDCSPAQADEVFAEIRQLLADHMV
ncbi:putative zinc-binding protein [Pseudomonas auratipiscis]|uniref:Zinc-binding protein n=1 Tax=Pseudomonas auratipiscis TaxID=3115853 RepID=A0AB35WMS1_9PSED|nr:MULTISPECIES: putative zinc-binding protein [unclassified Pseudomonas]MEE1865733.1 putative zinc-binding protein [Pseudomonas sp. 120P]MEE1957098.1 putative zinc-binding protein [Pseudomonas sp. 119P]